MNISEKMFLLTMKSNQRAKYAAMIIHRNKVIGVGYNCVSSYSTITTNDFYEVYKYSNHAERNAIMNVRNKNLLPSSKIVIVRLNDGKIVQAKPCKMCQNLLNKYKVSKICTLCGDKIIKS